MKTMRLSDSAQPPVLVEETVPQPLLYDPQLPARATGSGTREATLAAPRQAGSRTTEEDRAREFSHQRVWPYGPSETMAPRTAGAGNAKKELLIPFPGPHSPATPKVSVLCAALFCPVVILTGAQEK